MRAARHRTGNRRPLSRWCFISRPNDIELTDIYAFCGDIYDFIRRRVEFIRPTPSPISDSARIYVQVGIDSLIALRSARSDQRIPNDQIDSRTFRDPPADRARGNITSVEFILVQLPRRLGDLEHNLSSVGGSLLPVQEMAKLAAEEIARGDVVRNIAALTSGRTTMTDPGIRAPPLMWTIWQRGMPQSEGA